MMKTIKETLELALEVLITINNAIYVNSQQEADAFYKANDAITALREALASQGEALAEQPAQKRPQNCGTGYCSCIECVMEPAQQEPVAWKNAALRVGEDLCSVGPFGYYDMTAEQWLDWALSVVTVHAPPVSKPLTDEEIWKFWWSRPEIQEGEDDSMEAEFVAAVRRVLADHGIKGDA